jgi:hypothetical protein
MRAASTASMGAQLASAGRYTLTIASRPRTNSPSAATASRIISQSALQGEKKKKSMRGNFFVGGSHSKGE